MKIKNRNNFPFCLKPFKSLKGIAIGECIDKNNIIDDKHAAHAHCYNDKFKGWICLRFKYQLKERLTLLHEMAHIIANKYQSIPPHGKLWKATLLKIGGTYKPFFYTHNGKTYENLDYTYRNSKI
jgi:hypothetical protein